MQADRLHRSTRSETDTNRPLTPLANRGCRTLPGRRCGKHLGVFRLGLVDRVLKVDAHVAVLYCAPSTRPSTLRRRVSARAAVSAVCESPCVRACIGEERLWGSAARTRNDKHRDACARATTSTEMHARRPSVCARETVAAWVRTRADGRGIAHRPVTSASSTLPSRTSSEHCLHLSAARLHWDRQSIHPSTDPSIDAQHRIAAGPMPTSARSARTASPAKKLKKPARAARLRCSEGRPPRAWLYCYRSDPP